MALLAFFALTYAVMWACFIPLATMVPVGTPLGQFLVHLGAYSPSLVALAITARTGGRDGIRVLLAGVVRWQVAARWYVFAAGYIAAVKLAVAIILRVATGEWPRFGVEPWYLIPLAIAFSTPFQAGEEIGWRGFALPRLAARFGLARASILLGVIWACWHLPQFFIPEADTYQQSFPVYALQVTAISVAMAWLYAHTGGSVLLVMLLHSAVNNSKDIVPSASPHTPGLLGLNASPVAWLSVILLWVCAAAFLARMQPDGGITASR